MPLDRRMADARCGYCREFYDLGPSVGERFIYYPEGETRYWQHCLESEMHKRVMAAYHRAQDELLGQLPGILKERRRERDRARRLAKKEAEASAEAA